MELLGTVNYHLIDVFIISFSQAWRVEMNLFTKNIRGFVDFGKQAEPKNPCLGMGGSWANHSFIPPFVLLPWHLLNSGGICELGEFNR